MAFYDLSKDERIKLVEKIHLELISDLEKNGRNFFLSLFSNEDTYIRKSAYISVGRIYSSLPAGRKNIIHTLRELLNEKDFKVRQTVVNAAGEIDRKSTR